MACLAKNCTITGDDDRMVVCWLCHECCHVKCSGLSGLVADAISKNNGLHWCCGNCRNIGVNFYRCFQNTKTKFSELQNEAIKLNERIAAYGKLFDEFKSLDNLKSPPQRSPIRRKSPRNVNREKCDDFPAVETIHSSRTKKNEQHCAKSQVNPDPVPSVLNVPVVINNISPHVSNISKDDDSPSTSSKTNKTAPKQLNIIPPRKSIFISRFAFDTTADDIEGYIKSKIDCAQNIYIKKFSYSEPRSITSFKLTVPFDIYSKVVDPDFWPTNTFVREYLTKNNTKSTNVVRLPLSNTSSKN